MRDGSDDAYQIATLVVATLTVVAAIAMVMIFINPRVAFNPFKPPIIPTPIAIALPTLPPTWTPTATSTQTSTPTIAPTLTSTPTLTPSPTSTAFPTAPSPTRGPTRTPVATSQPPTPIPSPYTYKPTISCSHSGGTYIKGTVTNGGQPQDGIRVRVATSPDPAAVVEETFARGASGYSFMLKAIGSFGSQPAVWYVWIVDGTGTALSDPNFHFSTNNYPPDDARACWLAVVDFVR